jgi:hypothetical protein
MTRNSALAAGSIFTTEAKAGRGFSATIRIGFCFIAITVSGIGGTFLGTAIAMACDGW